MPQPLSDFFAWLGKLKNFKEIVATQGLAVFLIFVSAGYFIFYEQPRQHALLNKILDEQRADRLDDRAERAKWLTTLERIESALDPEKRPPLTAVQSLQILDLVTEQWLSKLTPRINVGGPWSGPVARFIPHSTDEPPAAEEDALAAQEAKPAAGPRQEPDKAPIPSAPAPYGPPPRLVPPVDIVYFYGESVVNDAKKPKKEKIQYIISLIKRGKESSERALKEVKQANSDQLKLAEGESQKSRSQLRQFKTEGATLEQIWRTAFEKCYKELYEDVMKCCQHTHNRQDDVVWQNVREFLKRNDFSDSEELMSLIPKVEPGSRDPCVAFADFTAHMHDECERLLRDKPLLGSK